MLPVLVRTAKKLGLHAERLLPICVVVVKARGRRAVFDAVNA
jgi:hypothetical protein